MSMNSPLRRAARLALVWITALSILNSQFALAALQSTAAVNSVREVSGVRAMLEQIEPLDATLDSAQFDLAEALFSLEFDADQIVRFVAEDIRFQAYPGLLRSAHGALISRSGNALDQGVLLARMLKDAGSEARIVRGRLTPSDARRLLLQMTGPTLWPSPWKKDAAPRVRNWIGERTQGPIDSEAFRPEAERLLSATLDATAAIRDEVVGIAGSSKPASVDARLVEEAVDYFWVEHRLGPGDPWQAVHPAFGQAEAPEVDAESYMADSIPSELQHRVRIEVKMEKRLGGAVQEVALMSPWERPAANAAYLPQTLAVLPYNGGTADSNQYLEAAANEAELFVLTLNDSIAPGAEVFTLEGDTLPLEALSGPGEFFKQVSDLGSTAVDAIDGLSLSAEEQAQRAPAKRLERLWIQYTLIGPDGEERAARRDILDLKGSTRFVHQQAVDDDRWMREARAALLQSRSLLVGTGPVNPAWLTSRILTTASEGRSTLLALEQRVSEADAEIGPSVLNGLGSLPDTRWVRYVHSTQTATGFGDGSAAYLHQPMLVSFNHGVRYDDVEGLRGYEQTDILFNARRVVERVDDTWERAPGTAALAGVLETQQEHLQMASRGGLNQQSAFASLADTPAGFVRLSPDDRSALRELSFAAGVQRSAIQELDAGYVLLVPRGSDADHWWRVDPTTGTTTGMGVGAGGYGGATAAEYIIYTGIIIGTLLMYYSFYNCFENESGLALFCCLVDSWLTGILVALVAFTIGALISAGITAGAGAGAAGAATAEAELVAAIVNFLILDVNSAVLSFTDFRIAACGSITGT